jgi:signal transduction histidine kinase
VVINLLSNAVKFSHENSEILVTTCIEPGCEIDIKDNTDDKEPSMDNNNNNKNYSSNINADNTCNKQSQNKSGLGDILTVKVSVTDHGIGIADDAQSKLFRPFTQADTSTTRKFVSQSTSLQASVLIFLVTGRLWARFIH